MAERRKRNASMALLLTAAMASPVGAEPVTMQQAVAIGVQRSPEIGRMQSRTGAAEAVRDQVDREWLPDISINAGAGLRHLENDARNSAGLSALDEKPLYATISADQPLLDFGRRGNELKAQEANLQAAREDEGGASEQVALELAKVYLQVVLQQRIVSASQQNLAFHEALAADVGEGVAKGAMSISEKQQANERLQLARVQTAQAQSDYVSASSELSLLLGRSDWELSLPESSGAAVPPTLDEALALAKANDTAVKAALARFAAAQHGTDRAGSERWPVVALRATYRYGKDFEGYRGQTKDAEGLVLFRWNVFDGGVTAAKIREASYKENDARFALAESERNSELQVRTGWSRLNTWRARLREQDERRSIASQVLQSYKAQFGIGRRSLLDVLDAQGALYNAVVETETARAGSLLAEYSLLAQLHQLNEFFGIQPTPIDPELYGPR